MWRHAKVKVWQMEGAPKVPLCLKCDAILSILRHFDKMGTRHFSLIGHHLESVNQTEPVLELTRAPSEKKPT